MVNGTERQTWVGVRLTARAPRIAVVIPDDEHWSASFRMAIHRTGQLWGGSAVAVVPQKEGRVSPALVKGVRAYDPDHVVSLAFDEASTAARDALRGATSSFHQRIANGDDDVVTTFVHQLPTDPRRGALTAARHERHDADPAVFLTCPATWSSGPVAAAIADRAGAWELPTDVGAAPDLDEEAADAIAAWLLGGRGADLPDDLVRWPSIRLALPTAGRETAHDLSQQGLEAVQDPAGWSAPGLLVCGAGAHDAALARLWRLVHGRGWWFPWGAERLRETTSFRAQAELFQRRTELRSVAADLLVVGAGDAAGSRDWPHPLSGEERGYLAPLVATTAGDLRWSRTPVSLAVADRFGLPEALPVLEDGEGTLACQVPVPGRLLTQTGLAGRDDVRWYVDVSWDTRGALPDGPVDARSLLVDPGPVARTWVRRSRVGLTYASHDHGLQLSGAHPVSRLAHPRLVMPGLDRWVRETARVRGVHVGPSEAGRRSRLLAEMCGSRRAWVELFAGPLRPVLRKLADAGRATRSTFPGGGGVCLSTGAVIAWPALGELWDGEDRGLRVVVDAACEAGVLRRDLVLRCQDCAELQFVRLELLGQRWTCLRCERQQQLSQDAWNLPVDEPLWFYDLHPVARRTLVENGDVVALLAAHLDGRAAAVGGRLEWVEEVELMEGSTPRAEVDLIAYDGVLRVAECKSGMKKSLTKSDVARKCFAADVLRADELVFATTQPHWSAPARQLVERGVGAHAWSGGSPPAVRLLSGLGLGDDVVDEVL